MKVFPSTVIVGGARHHRVGPQPGPQQRQAADALERRAGRELAVGREVVAVVPRPVGGGQDVPGRGSDRDQGAGRADVREQPLGGELEPLVQRGPQRLAAPGADPEQLVLLAVGVDRVHHGTGGPLQLVVVPRLQPGQPRLVTGLVAVRLLLDHLGGHLADGAEDRGGELLGRCQRQAAAEREHARDVLVAVDRRGHLALAVDDGLDVRLVAGGLDPLGVRRGVDVEERGEPPGGLPRALRRDARPVDPEPHDGAVGDELLSVRAEDLAALGRDRGEVEGDPVGQAGLDHGRVPGDLPLVVDLGHPGLRVIGPRATADRPGPRQRGGRGVAGLAHVVGGDVRLGVAHALDGGAVGLVHLRRRPAGELHAGERPGGQGGGQVVGRLVGVGTGGLRDRVAPAQQHPDERGRRETCGGDPVSPHGLGSTSPR